MAQGKVFMDARRVIDLLAQTDEQQMQVVDLLDQLRIAESDTEWTVERLHAVVSYSVERGAFYAGLS